ncbi:MAG TPA: hypothetical protein VD766_05630 [Solirubrobacterales bacterium]|nr:hypothetical protein [Solirubrobacterales bacterium]
MRPERDNIAAPELPGRIKWLNRSEPPKMAELTAAGPVLVHFWDPTQLNSVRALPYVVEWNRRYSPHGLTTLGIHSPRFALTADAEVTTEAIERLDVEHAVALDLDYAIWHDYGCIGWPSLFLWGQGGSLRWAHRGEGEYRATEEAIQDELREANALAELPPPMDPLRATDEADVLVPVPTPEIFPGGSVAEPWVASSGKSHLKYEYEAGEAWIVADGEGEIGVTLDGEALEPIEISPAALMKLAGTGRHQAHRLELDVTDGVRVWAISFAPGAPV